MLCRWPRGERGDGGRLPRQNPVRGLPLCGMPPLQKTRCLALLIRPSVSPYLLVLAASRGVLSTLGLIGHPSHCMHCASWSMRAGASVIPAENDRRTHARRAYHIHSRYGDKVGSCYPELLAKVPGHASQPSQVPSRAPAPCHTLPYPASPLPCIAERAGVLACPRTLACFYALLHGCRAGVLQAS